MRFVTEGHLYRIFLAGETTAKTISDEVESENPKKPCVGQFGSFIGQFNDGMSISLSTYGGSGQPENGEDYRYK